MRCLTMIGLLLGLGVPLCPATAQQPDAAGATTGNAAVQYWQAFALLPTLDKDEEKKVEDWNKVPLDAAVRKMTAACEASLMYLHRAAKLDRCDWGLDYNDGVSLLLPHLTKARSLARLAALDARQKFEQGDSKTAIEDVMSMMKLARHIEREPIMISVLVGYAIEDMTIELAGQYIPKYKAEFAAVAPQLKALPQGATIEQTLAVEKKFMAEWTIRKVREAEQKKPGSWRDLWKSMLEGSYIPDAVRNVGSAEEVIKLTQELLPVYDELAKVAALPKEQFDRQYPAFKKKTEAANPMAGVLLPAVDKFLAKERRLQARRAMLASAINVVQGGAEKIQQSRDPFGDGPFEYRATDKGFELESKLTFDNQPVKLIVGPPSKQ